MSLKVPSTASSWSTENKNNKNKKSRYIDKRESVCVSVFCSVYVCDYVTFVLTLLKITRRTAQLLNVCGRVC